MPGRSRISLIQFLMTGVAGLTLSACSGSGSSSAPPPPVVVTPPNSAPVLSGDMSFELDENSDFETTLTATDADNDPLTFSMDGSGDGQFFSLASNGTLSAAGPFDFEDPQDAGGDNAYTLTIEISDGEDTTTASVTVNVGQVNEAPAFMGVSSFSAVEREVFAAALSALDPEEDTLTFELDGSGDGQYFSMSADGMLSANTEFDFEAPVDGDGNNVFGLSVSISDGEFTTDQDLTITLGDTIEADMTFKAFGLGGSILKDFTVTLYDADDTLFGEFTAEGDGLTLDLPVGEYRAEFTKHGYKPHELTMCPVTQSDPNDCEVELLLGDVALEVVDVERISGSYMRLDQRADEGSFAPSITPDGRYVVFESDASNIVEGDTNGCRDVFVRDLQENITKRVSIASDGSEGNYDSLSGSISADGKMVAFMSFADNLVTDDNNGRSDIFVHNMETGVTQRVSIASDGTEADSNSASPFVSADGKVIAFMSRANNLSAKDNTNWDVFVHDMKTGATDQVSVTSNGIGGNNPSINAALSADGQIVVFHSFADNLVDGLNKNPRLNLGNTFAHERRTGITERISPSGNNSHNFIPNTPSITADGQYVAYASDLRVQSSQSVFVFDRDTDENELTSYERRGFRPNDNVGYSNISYNGRFVTYASRASNLVDGDTNDRRDIFVTDRRTGMIERVSVHRSGRESEVGVLGKSSISADGRTIVFDSLARDLVRDTNPEEDIFVVTREPVE